MSEATQILKAIEQGDPKAAEQLLPLVYEELRKLAARKLSQEEAGQTLEPTALVHEAYLRLVGAGNVSHWDSREHFFAAAAEAMRRILVDRARHKQRQRHGGGLQKKSFEDIEPAVTSPVDTIDLLSLNEALERLEASYPRRARLVKLRYFAGF